MDISWLILEEERQVTCAQRRIRRTFENLIVKITGLWNAIIYKINRQNILILPVAQNGRPRYFLLAAEFSLGAFSDASFHRQAACTRMPRTSSHSSRFQPLRSAVFATRDE
ncbi:hypothetical protein HFO12_06300 [Rhizobium leguminosarum]|nr:hypothetical protein [Rhizobium leguminosarum]